MTIASSEGTAQQRGGIRRSSASNLWASREMVWFLAWRDVRVRYKQTLLGFGWAVAQPLLGAALLTLVFGRFVGVDGDGTSYLLFGLAGYALWTSVAAATNGARVSVVQNAALVTRVPFPRLVLPVGAVLPPLLDLAVVTPMVLVVATASGHPPGMQLLLAPAFVVGATLVAFGVGTLLSALTVLYRDVHHVFTYMLQLWLFASPVAYPASLVDPGWRWLYAANPLAGLLDGWRWSIAGGSAPDWTLGVSALTGALTVGLGIGVFRRLEPLFPDVI